MYELIRRALEGLRLPFAPGTGRRRRPQRSASLCLRLPVGRRTAPPPRELPRHRSPYGLPTPLDGADSALVRPYLAAREREVALRQHRRLTLVLAADFGIDLDQHLIGAERVAV